MAGLDPPPDHDTPGGGACAQPFIVTTSITKHDPATRRLIRSHVMRGINRGKPRARRAAKDSPESARILDGRLQEVVAKPTVVGSVGDIVGGWSPAAAAGARESMWAIFTPAKLASEISLTRTTAVLTPPMQQLIYECKFFFFFP